MTQKKGPCKELRSFKCHLVIISHEKTRSDEKKKKKKVNCDYGKVTDMLKPAILLGMSRL